MSVWDWTTESVEPICKVKLDPMYGQQVSGNSFQCWDVIYYILLKLYTLCVAGYILKVAIYFTCYFESGN